ncbi:unnamed protein product, partial [Lymnaea stagnalis]
MIRSRSSSHAELVPGTDEFRISGSSRVTVVSETSNSTHVTSTATSDVARELTGPGLTDDRSTAVLTNEQSLTPVPVPVTQVRRISMPATYTVSETKKLPETSLTAPEKIVVEKTT